MATHATFKDMLRRRREALISHARVGDLEVLSRSDAEELRTIDAALDRLKKGTYGKCSECGEDISEDRLLVLPESPLCRDCAGHDSDEVFDNMPV